MKKTTIIFIVFITFLNTGCFLKQKDLGQMLFPVSLGISYENNEYNVYLQVIDTSALSIVETETSQTQTTYILIHAKNENINNALSELGLKALTYVSAVKLKSIILHKSIFDEGKIEYHEIFNYFINNPVFRNRVQTFITTTDLEQFYSVKYMLVGASVYSHTNEDEPQIIRGFSTSSYLIDSLKSYHENNRMYHFPIMNVQNKTISEGDNEGKLKEINSYYYDGMCFTTYNETRIECLKKEEALGYRYYKELEYISEVLETNKNPINIIIDKIKWSRKINDFKFVIDVDINAIINLNITDLTINEIKEEFNQKIHKNITNTLKNAHEKSIDIYHLNDYAYRKNKDLTYDLSNVIININTTFINSTYYTH